MTQPFSNWECQLLNNGDCLNWLLCIACSYKKTQSVGINHFPLGIAITMAQDNYKICQKHLIPKLEYFSTLEQLKLMATGESSKTRHGYYILSKNQFLFAVSYAEHCFLILSVRNLPDISQFEGQTVVNLINANIPTYNKCGMGGNIVKLSSKRAIANM